MSRGELPEERLIEIRDKHPDFSRVHRLLSLEPRLVAALAGPESLIDVAHIALDDAAKVAWEITYAIGEANAHLIWYREESPDAPQEYEAHLFCKFYVDDAALRIYAAGEFIAAFIVNFLKIEKAELSHYQIKHGSLAKTVGEYLFNEKPNHPICAIITKLLDNTPWTQVINYRNIWVHEQPPLLQGLGIGYQRKSGWKKTDAGNFEISFGGGDAPEYAVEELLELVSQTSHGLIKALSDLTDLYLSYAESLGIDLD